MSLASFVTTARGLLAFQVGPSIFAPLFILGLVSPATAAQAQSPALHQLSLEQLMDIEIISVAKKEQKVSATAAGIYVISQVPSVAPLDLKLPKADGLEVRKRIREHEQTKFLPVVILTSSKKEQVLLQGYSLGANSYIRKPVDFLQFIDAVRQLGLYWLLLNEAAPQAR